jgi:hypothetical protein
MTPKIDETYINGGIQLKIRKRIKYADLSIDLWSSNWWRLSEQGRKRLLEVFKRIKKSSENDKPYIYVNYGVALTCAHLHHAKSEIVEKYKEEIVTILSQEENLKGWILEAAKLE